MHRIFRVKAYEQEHGPHFDEVMAHKAVSKMENVNGNVSVKSMLPENMQNVMNEVDQ